MGESVLEILSRSVERVTESGYLAGVIGFLLQLTLLFLLTTTIYYLIHIGNSHVAPERRILIGRRHLLKGMLAFGLLLVLLALFNIWGDISDILSPFIGALILAYLLNPLVKILHKKGLNRGVAVLTIYLAVSLAILGLSLTIIPTIGKEIKGLLELLPEFSHRAYVYINQLYNGINQNLQNLPPELDGIKNLPTINAAWIQQAVINAFTNVTNRLIGIFSSIFSVILAPVLSFYFLKDAEQFQRSLVLLIPMKSRKKILEMFREFDQVLGGFIRGQLIVASFVGVLTIVALLLLDVRFAVILGILAGVCDLIPYFGPFIGAVPAVFFALMISPVKALWVIVSAIIIQQIESNVLSPKIVGESVGLHPVWVVMALLVGSKFFGLLGLLFAVPVAGILKILGKYLVGAIAEFK